MPVAQSGDTITICLPESEGIDMPFEVVFQTGTGQCMVEETLQIWNLGDFDLDLGPDLEICEGDCVDLEAIVPNDGLAGATISWTPATYLNSTSDFEVEACIPVSYTHLTLPTKA